MKKIIIGTAMAMGILSVGAISAFAADPSCGKCADQRAVQQFQKETASLTATINAKDLKLREMNSYESIDPREAGALENDIRELKDNINATAIKYGIPACSRS
ncbi:MAG: hypothetical protein A2079_03865 [Geobacteraceae bacterium GWC2_48_7]|nr:MAG: hypothetical protein A2079_03865 [Geobacteraceae bacterium GWC2_48_7]